MDADSDEVARVFRHDVALEGRATQWPGGVLGVEPDQAQCLALGTRELTATPIPPI
jgi:hypothetical protein